MNSARSTARRYPVFSPAATSVFETERGSEFGLGDTALIARGSLATSQNGLHHHAFYETEARDKVIGVKSDSTGMTVWYVGPPLALTWGEHLAANAGADFPMVIANNGLQKVPESRVGGISFRF